MSKDKENDGIIKIAGSVPRGTALSLRTGGSIKIDWLPEDDGIDRTYYVSIFHDEKIVGIGVYPTKHTVETCKNDIKKARMSALVLARQWNYETQERI